MGHGVVFIRGCYEHIDFIKPDSAEKRKKRKVKKPKLTDKQYEDLQTREKYCKPVKCNYVIFFVYI